MTEKENIQFVKLLEKFIDDCGLGEITACKQAQKLLAILNDEIPENPSIKIPLSSSDLEDLQCGETFDWTFDGVDVHLYQTDDEE